MKSNHQRYRGVGANVRRLEHVNLMARDVRACREFWADGLGLRLARPRFSHPATIVCLRGDHDRHPCLPGDHDHDRYVLYAAPAAKERRMIV
jgi:catechol 2,3-dioxygenase-like lactoylglutathione lyase family enzyme